MHKDFLHEKLSLAITWCNHIYRFSSIFRFLSLSFSESMHKVTHLVPSMPSLVDNAPLLLSWFQSHTHSVSSVHSITSESTAIALEVCPIVEALAALEFFHWGFGLTLQSLSPGTLHPPSLICSHANWLRLAAFPASAQAYMNKKAVTWLHISVITFELFPLKWREWKQAIKWRSFPGVLPLLPSLLPLCLWF